jgi:hypothetical protein
MFTDHHRPDAVRILDFPHAGEHINELLEALGKAKMHFPPYMLERCLHVLKHRGPRPLLRMADRMPNDLVGQKGVHEHLDYLRKREAMMQYPQFRRDGWPIGSGMVESANKNAPFAWLYISFARRKCKYELSAGRICTIILVNAEAQVKTRKMARLARCQRDG